ncbi:choice-of-anchor M domain-containing protein [Conexibacter sp. CPCC 206217]|uniref:choice-of-anchor M domain-containing protein n=1 Tax=Conexibacter sp. CPCC 206217 TaxID=3064574 RepID=UPI0027206268|nr:choice-of-anchor M domain-containing protein [Conexibacter sp. CPCC 206217]MDO8213124.1 choice-of-anchor M domain-containing protein [Conexibacter sp. CPCC 206217]
MNRTTRGRAAIAFAICAAGMAATAPVALARTVLSTGHADVVAAKMRSGRLVSLVKDSTRGGTTVWRDPAGVTIRVVPKARTTLPAGLGFVGPSGSPAWLIPQVQRAGVIWAGWNTEEITTAMVRGSIAWTVSKVSGPGKLVVFQTGAFGHADVLFDSGRRMPQTQQIPLGTHAHGNWAFTKRGTYKFTYALAGRSTSGASLRAASTLTFVVG